jgi:hypothetical protein
VIFTHHQECPSQAKTAELITRRPNEALAFFGIHVLDRLALPQRITLNGVHSLSGWIPSTGVRTKCTVATQSTISAGVLIAALQVPQSRLMSRCSISQVICVTRRSMTSDRMVILSS